MTNNFTFNRKVQDRVSKAWGYNVGPGPLWELLEDRGWYKETTEVEDSVERDANRRPRVHENVKVKTDWQILNAEYVFYV
jgi:transcription factor C subunit 6